MEWKKALPFIGALATGGVPALVGAAAQAIGEALGTKIEARPDAIDEALKAATPEQVAALRKVDADLKVALRQADVEERRIAAGTETAYIEDATAARKAHAKNDGVLILGYLINIASYGLAGCVLWGAFLMMAGDGPRADPSVAATVGAIIGAVVQWLMSNAAQANGFFFGSSPSARANSAAMAEAVRDAIKGKGHG